MTIPSGDVARMLAGRAKLAELATLFSPGIEPPPPLSPAARKQMRRRMFAERPIETVSRMFRAGGAALRRDGLGGCLRAAALLLREKSIGALGLPDPERAMTSPDGLCGLADDLSAATLMDGYERGLYPFAHFGPMKWWAPKTRALAGPALLSQRLAGADFDDRIGATVAFDRDFEAAVCDETIVPPIPPRLKWAFARLFDAGFAHSFDVMARNGERIGGGFGVAVGRVFVIEAMRFKNAAAMQAGVSVLAHELNERCFLWVDAKRLTPELAACGFDATPRAGYASRLKASLGCEKVGRWTNWQFKHAA